MKAPDQQHLSLYDQLDDHDVTQQHLRRVSIKMDWEIG